MARPTSASRFSFLSLLLLISILACIVAAQGPGGGAGGGAPGGGQGQQAPQGPQGQQSQPAQQGQATDGLPNLASITGAKASDTKAAGGKSTAAANTDNSPKSDGKGAAKTNTAALPQITGNTQNNAKTSGVNDNNNLPSLTGGDVPNLTGLPTLSQFLIPSAIVPDTSNAPFMQKSDLPEGTVFIAVGATLGFLAACILLWRGMIAYSMQRSAKRAAYAHSDEKAGFRPQAPSGYNSAFQSGYHSANLSMESLNGTKTGYEGASQRKNKDNKSRKPSSRVPTASSLFFSPTAGVGSGVQTVRTSTYLPAGYYASGASAPAAGNPITSLGGPPAAGYARMDSSDSPPISPGLRPEIRRNDSSERDSTFYGTQRRDPRRATGGLAQSSSMETFGGRAPSQYLDDVLESHGSAMNSR